LPLSPAAPPAYTESLDAEFPAPYQPWPPPEDLTPPAAAPAREPAWSGLEVVVIILFSLLAIVFFTFVAVAGLALAAHWSSWRVALGTELSLVAITLLGQTGGFAAGFAFAWLWISDLHAVRFWRAIHWRGLRPGQVAAVLLGGTATMVAVQLLGHLLPMPSELPMDQLFTPRTAWLLAIYGVAIAPFFEEFIFRGLIYPTLRSTFQEGVASGELRAWRPLVRLLGVLGLVGIAYWLLRIHILALPVGRVGEVGGTLAVGACLMALALPGLPLAAAGWGVNRMAGWRRPELLAISVTGLLFGLLHASQLGWAWAAVLILVLVGVALTAVRAATGSLMASWLFHCAYNGSLFAAQFVATQGFHHFPPGH